MLNCETLWQRRPGQRTASGRTPQSGMQYAVDGSKCPQIILTNLSLPGVSLLEISVTIQNINKGSPSRAGFKGNPAHCITHRWGIWKTSDYDSYHMMHSLVKITPLMLPSSPFHLLFLCLLLMTSLRNSVQKPPSLSPACAPQVHPEITVTVGHALASWLQDPGPRSPPQTLASQTSSLVKEGRSKPAMGRRRETHQPQSCVFLFLTRDRIQICSSNL